MDCPKCGAPKQDGRVECSSCGIIFARWQPRQPRITLNQPAPALPETPKSAGLPPWLLITVVAVVVVFGLTWTARRRAARKPDTLDEKLNAIYAKNVQRQHEREAAQRAQNVASGSASPSSTASPGVLTPELESSARQLLEQCSFFSQPIKFEIPKELTRAAYADLVNKQPMVGGMVRLHFIDLEPPPDRAGSYETMEVAPTEEVRGAIMVVDDGNSLRVDAGRRKLDSVRGSAPTGSRMYVSFEWSYEISAAQELGDNRSRLGRATMDRDAGGAWRIFEATVDISRGKQSICP